MEILTVVFNMSFTGSIIFLIFLLLRPISKRYFSSFWHYIMLVLILTFFILPAYKFIDLPINPILDRSSLGTIESLTSPGNIIGN